MSERVVVFVVGRFRARTQLFDPETADSGVRFSAWDLIAIASIEAAADRLCTKAVDFYFPVTLDNAAASDLTVPMNPKWPRRRVEPEEPCAASPSTPSPSDSPSS